MDVVGDMVGVPDSCTQDGAGGASLAWRQAAEARFRVYSHQLAEHLSLSDGCSFELWQHKRQQAPHRRTQQAGSVTSQERCRSRECVHTRRCWFCGWATARACSPAARGSGRPPPHPAPPSGSTCGFKRQLRRGTAVPPEHRKQDANFSLARQAPSAETVSQC